MHEQEQRASFHRGGWREVGAFDLVRPEELLLTSVGRLPLSNERDEAVLVELPSGSWEVALWETPADGRVYDVRVAPANRPGSRWNVDEVVLSPIDDGLRLLGWVQVGQPGRQPGVAVLLGRVVDAFPPVPSVDDGPAAVIDYWSRSDEVADGFLAALASGTSQVCPGAWTSRCSPGQFPVVARFRDGWIDEVRVSILPARVR